MRTCRQLTSNAIQGYANRRNINNQPPSSLPRLQHALLLTPASVAALGHSTRCNNIDKGDARALYYANSILRGSSMYSFTLTICSHDNNISRLPNEQKVSPRTKEGHSLSSVQHPMVVRQRNDHNRPYHNLPIHDDRSILRCVHPCCFKFPISLRLWGPLEAKRSHAPSTAD
jgi:hypothetical protein